MIVDPDPSDPDMLVIDVGIEFPKRKNEEKKKLVDRHISR